MIMEYIIISTIRKQLPERMAPRGGFEIMKFSFDELKYLIAEGNVLLLAKAGVPGLLCNGRIGFI